MKVRLRKKIYKEAIGGRAIIDNLNAVLYEYYERNDSCNNLDLDIYDKVVETIHKLKKRKRIAALAVLSVSIHSLNEDESLSISSIKDIQIKLKDRKWNGGITLRSVDEFEDDAVIEYTRYNKYGVPLYTASKYYRRR